MVTIDGQDYLTTAEAMERLGVARQKFWQLLGAYGTGRVEIASFVNPYQRNQKLIDPAEIERYQARLRAAVPEPRDSAGDSA